MAAKSQNPKWATTLKFIHPKTTQADSQPSTIKAQSHQNLLSNLKVVGINKKPRINKSPNNNSNNWLCKAASTKIGLVNLLYQTIQVPQIRNLIDRLMEQLQLQGEESQENILLLKIWTISKVWINTLVWTIILQIHRVYRVYIYRKMLLISLIIIKRLKLLSFRRAMMINILWKGWAKTNLMKVRISYTMILLLRVTSRFN